MARPMYYPLLPRPKASCLHGPELWRNGRQLEARTLRNGICLAPQDQHCPGEGRAPARGAETVSAQGLPRCLARVVLAAWRPVFLIFNHMVPAIADRKQSKTSLEGANLPSFLHVANDFFSQKEPERRVFFFLKKKKYFFLVNERTDSSAAFPSLEEICVKGGHFDKACKLSWAQGNFWANGGPAELLKNFSEPQRATSF